MQIDFATRLRRLIPFILVGTGIFFIVLGVLINYFKSHQNVSGRFSDSEKESSVAGEINARKIKIDISGAVQRPGLYEIPDDSRVADVLISAGGLSPKADRKYVSRYINLAQRLGDGMKIYFPFEGEGTTGSLAVPSSANVTSLININSATLAQLDTLPGVGAVTANKIIAGRPYQNISELVSRGIVSKSVFEKIKDKITTL
jgi:competence protein ComEA